MQAFYPIESNAVVLLPSERLKVNVDITEEGSIVRFIEPITMPVEQTIIQKIIAFLKRLFWFI